MRDVARSSRSGRWSLLQRQAFERTLQPGEKVGRLHMGVGRELDSAQPLVERREFGARAQRAARGFDQSFEVAACAVVPPDSLRQRLLARELLRRWCVERRCIIAGAQIQFKVLGDASGQRAHDRCGRQRPDAARVHGSEALARGRKAVGR